MYKKERLGIHIILVLLSFPNAAKAQYSFAPHDGKYIYLLESSKTIIEITGIDSLDKIIKATINDQWKRPVIYATSEETDSILTKYPYGAYAILGLFSYKVESLSSTSMCLYLPADIGHTRMKNILAAVPIECSSCYTLGGKKIEKKDECHLQDVVYKYNVIVSQLIETLNFVIESEYQPTLAHITGLNKYIDLRNSNIKKEVSLSSTKHLLISRNLLENDEDTSVYQEIYPNIHFVIQKEYLNIIGRDDTNYVYLISGKNPTMFFSVFDPIEDRTLFISEFKVAVNRTVGLKSKHIIRVKRQIKKLEKN